MAHKITNSNGSWRAKERRCTKLGAHSNKRKPRATNEGDRETDRRTDKAAAERDNWPHSQARAPDSTVGDSRPGDRRLASLVGAQKSGSSWNCNLKWHSSWNMNSRLRPLGSSTLVAARCLSSSRVSDLHFEWRSGSARVRLFVRLIIPILECGRSSATTSQRLQLRLELVNWNYNRNSNSNWKWNWNRTKSKLEPNFGDSKSSSGSRHLLNLAPGRLWRDKLHTWILMLPLSLCCILSPRCALFANDARLMRAARCRATTRSLVLLPRVRWSRQRQIASWPRERSQRAMPNCIATRRRRARVHSTRLSLIENGCGSHSLALTLAVGPPGTRFARAPL